METIVSGATTGRMARALLLTVMFVGYASWSLYDGYVAYPRANVEGVLRSKLALSDVDPSLEPHPEITPRSVAEAEIVPGTPWERVRARWGPPQIEHQGLSYYLGAGGYVTIESRGGGIGSVQWSDGPVHAPASIGFQKLIGFALVPIVLVLLVQLVRVLRTRVVLTAESLRIGGDRPLSLDSITAVTLVAPGRFDLMVSEGGKTRSVRLDDYVVARVPEIIRAICSHRGLPDPFGEN